DAPRLLSRLEGNSAPALDSLDCSRNQMRVSAAGNHGDNPEDAKLSAFLDRPFHAVEFEDRKKEDDVRCVCNWDFLAEFKVDAAAGDASDSSAADCGAGSDIEFLTDPRA